MSTLEELNKETNFNKYWETENSFKEDLYKIKQKVNKITGNESLSDIKKSVEILKVMPNTQKELAALQLAKSMFEPPIENIRNYFKELKTIYEENILNDNFKLKNSEDINIAISAKYQDDL